MSKSVFVIDTNVLIDYPDIITNGNDVLEESSVDLSNAHIVIPTAVVRELSSFKKEHSDRGRTARNILKHLQELVETEEIHKMEDFYSLKAQIAIKTGNKDQLISILPIDKDFTKKIKFNPSSNDMDGQIILAALTTAKQYSNVVLLTNDNGLAIRAYARGIKTSRYSYKIPPLYTGRRDITVPSDLFENFVLNKQLTLEEWEEKMPNEPKLIANEFIIMHPENDEYPAVYGEKEELYFCNIGRFDKKENTILPLRYANSFPSVIKNPGQAIYAEALLDPTICVVICTGPAGTGKTYMGTVYAYEACKQGQFIGAAIVPCKVEDDGVGYLPGYLDDKLDPNVQPIKQALRNYIMKEDKNVRKELENLSKFGAIEVGKKPNERDSNQQSKKSLKSRLNDQVDLDYENWFGDPIPIAYARGQDFSYQVAIYDEFQDQNYTQADTLLKRIGKNGKMIITGDIEQLHAAYLDRENNGLTYARRITMDSPMVAQITFTEDEVIRHPFVKMIAERQKARTKEEKDSIAHLKTQQK